MFLAIFRTQNAYFIAVLFTILFISAPFTSIAAPLEPDWSATASIPDTGRPNPYGWDATTLELKIKKGQMHALNYPVQETGLLIPAKAALRVLTFEKGDPFFGLVKTLLGLHKDFKNFKGFWDWLGLSDYPITETEIPFPNDTRPDYPMGVSIIKKIEPHGMAEGFTLSCAACHSSNLFGKPVLGLTNRFPRANLFFIHGQTSIEKISPGLFATIFNINKAEKDMYRESRRNIASVAVAAPQALGLDASLAQVALSLAKRNPDEWATRSKEYSKKPRVTILDNRVADSKPAVWWNVKYKTHWLSDGSVRSGNPIFTNFLWNEIGRGVDLPKLTEWLEHNPDVVEELTTAVFATQAPKWREFHELQAIRVDRAKRGEAVFAQNCAHCHGTYQKNWNETTDTLAVHYKEKIVDVGTDPGRRQGMRALAEGLNPLAFSKKHKIVIEEQAGYVPPPLEGIWARYPYLHNNSIPNLCALMTPPENRPKVYFAGKAISPERDYDQNCVGYPLDTKTPKNWKDKDHRFDTTKAGLSNTGHYDRIFRTLDGKEKLTTEQKTDLLEFLKTL